MSALWSETRLGDICDIQSGAGFPKKYQGIRKGDLPFYKVSDMNSEGNEVTIDASKNYVSNEIRKQLGAKILPKGSVIFPKVGGAIITNKKRITATDCCVDNNVMGLMPKRDHIDPVFLWYFLESLSIYEWSNKSNPPSIRKSTVAEWPLRLPKLKEQKRIVAILDEAFAGIETAIANTEKNLTNVGELFNSFLDQNAAPCESKAIRMGDYFETVTGNTPPKKDSENWGGFIPLVKPPELQDSCVSDAADSLSEKGAAKARVAPKDAVLVSCIGNLGKVALTEVPVAFNQQINAIFPRRDIMLPEFLFFQTLATQFKRQLHSVSSGTTVSIVNKSKFNELRLYAPALNEQKRIVDELQMISHDTQALCVLIQKKLDSLGELKQSLLQKAFSGELTAALADRQVETVMGWSS